MLHFLNEQRLAPEAEIEVLDKEFFEKIPTENVRKASYRWYTDANVHDANKLPCLVVTKADGIIVAGKNYPIGTIIVAKDEASDITKKQK